MKVTIQLKQADKQKVVLEALLKIVGSSSSLQALFKTKGVVFELANSTEVALVKIKFTIAKVSGLSAAETTVRLRDPKGDLKTVSASMTALLAAGDEIAQLLWTRGLTLEDVGKNDAEALKQSLEAETANVTINGDAPQSLQFVVAGQVRRSDQTPFIEPGHTVRVFDAVSDTEVTPLGRPVSLSAQGTYRIVYNWQSSQGRNGPSLVVRLFAPDETVIAEAGKQFATRNETLDLAVSASAPRTFTIFGDVRDAATGQVLPDVAVTAAFRSEETTLLTQSSRSGDNGAFRIRFDQGLFADPSRPIAVTFELSQDGQPLHTDTTIARLAPQDQKVDVRASRPEPAEATLVVRGTVRDGQGRPLAGLRVDARDRDLRSEQPLGQADTDSNGAYRIPYAANSLLRAERGTADLIIRVLNDDHEPYVARAETEAGQPLPSFRLRSAKERDALEDVQVLVNAPDDAVINLVVTDAHLRSPSEYERYLHTLRPLIENTAVAELADGELAFLATETGLPPEHLNLLRAAERLGLDTKLAATLFYGLFRQGLGSTLTQLLVHASEDRRRALEASLRDGIIPPMTDAEIDRALAALDDLLIAQAAGDLPTAEPSPLGDLLATAVPDAAVRSRFARAYAAYDGKDTEGFWRDVAAIPEIGAERAQDLRFSLQLARLSGNHLPLIKAVQGERKAGRLGRAEDLVRLDEDGWTAIIRSQVDNAPVGVPADIPGADDEQRTQNYARMLTAMTEAAFPTPALVAQVARTRRNDLGALPAFVANNPDFDISRTPIRRFIAEKGDRALTGVNDPAAFTDRIAAVQRVRKVAPRPGHALALTAEGLDSAHAIHLRGPEAFTLQFAEALGGSEPARLAYARAEKQSAMSLALYTKYHLQFNVGNPQVLPAGIRWGEEEDASFSPGVRATLRELFGSLDFCQCEHCRSMFSPAAYLTDCLFRMLGECRPLAETDPSSTYSLLDAFRERRPDILSIELNCANTHTPLPYIDLVNEVLEAAVAPGKLTLGVGTLGLPTDFSKENRRQKHDVPVALRDVFQQQANNLERSEIELTDSAYVTLCGPESGPNIWTVHNGVVCYRLSVESGSLNAIPYPQTTRTAEQLRAAPEHLNAEAYDAPQDGQPALREAVYPPTLPFDLWLETVRVFLAHLGTSRSDVMRAFADNSPENLPAIAHEELGLSPAEAGIVVTADDDLAAYYGLTDPADVSAFARGPVADILARAAISYDDLLRLLDTDFVNPDRRVGLDSPDAGCDLTTITLAAAEDHRLALLERLHRFMRLQRKLGWPVTELDRAIAAVAAHGDDGVSLILDDDALRKLAILRRLRERLPVPFDELLTLWGEIDTRDHTSLYHHLFLNPTVVGPVDPSFALPLPGTPIELAGHETTVLAGLRLSAADLKAIQEEAAGAETISLPSLSILCRHAVLARILRLRLPEVLVLRRLITDNPFEARNPLATSTFIDQVAEIRAAGFTIAELAYLYLDPVSVDLSNAALREYVARVSDGLRPGEKEIESFALTLAVEPPAAPTTDDAGALLAPSAENVRAALLTLGMVESDIEAALTFLQGPQRDDERARTQIEFLFGSFLDVSEACGALLDTDATKHASPNKMQFVLIRARLTRDIRDSLLAIGLPDTDIAAILTFLQRPQADGDEPRAQIETLFGSFLNASEAHAALLDTDAARHTLADKLQFVLIRARLTRDIRDSLLAIGLPERDAGATLRFLRDPRPDDDAGHAQINRLFAFFIPTAAAYAALLNADGVTRSQAEKLAFVARHARTASARWKLTRDLIPQALATTLGFDTDVATDLCDRLPSYVHPRLPARFDFLAIFPAEAPPLRAPLSRPTRLAFLRLHKIAMLVTGFRLTLEELTYLASHGLALDEFSGALDGAAPAARPSFGQWQMVRAYTQLRDRLPRSTTRLIDVLTARTDEGAGDLLQLLTGWEREEIPIAPEAPIRTVDRLARLREQFALSRRTGVKISTLREWATTAPDRSQAGQVREATKSKYADSEWLEVARKLEDELREKRRDALVAYLVHNPNRWRTVTLDDAPATANDLSANFLIDVEMCSCQLTSRIRQAIAAVQLFVQRCLLGLETKADTGQRLEISPEMAKQWELWRRLYRMWEANRKVLLYPENWIRPELRDDKSPFFRDLENALLQNEVTDDTVETAYRRYLEQLSEVARLDIVGIHAERGGETDIVHVFGRTPGTPHRYFYRRLVDSNYWTAWERVDLDIEGDHLMPIVWNRRLYLFWATFTEKAEEPTGEIPAGSPGRPPRKYWEIRIAFSEYKNGQWTSKKLSEDFFCTNSSRSDEITDMPRSNYALRSEFGVNLTIVVYAYRPRLKLYVQRPIDIPSSCKGIGEFYFDDCRNIVSMKMMETERELKVPEGIYVDASVFDESTYSDDILYLPEPRAANFQTETLYITPGTFRLCFPLSQPELDATRDALFFQDDERVYFVQKEILPSANDLPRLRDGVRYGDTRSPFPGGTNEFRGTVTGTVITRAADRSVPAIENSPSANNFISVIKPTAGDWSAGALPFETRISGSEKRYVFRPHYHPFVCLFLEQLNRFGIPGLLDPAPAPSTRTIATDANRLRRQRIQLGGFAKRYDPNRDVVAPETQDPIEEIEFDADGAYSLYNWELFFHIPLLVADRLTQNQRFAEARKWLHYIFDPTIGADPSVHRHLRDGPARFWKIRPFYEDSDAQATAEELMRRLNAGDENLGRLIDRWENDPFNPHLIARLALTKYMRATVMTYLDNLIAWGDYLFAQDTQESVAEATQLYILAADILGPRPNIIPPRGEPAARTFEGLEGLLDDLSNALVRIEEEFELPQFSYPTGRSRGALPRLLYFCIPPNDKLFGYWDKVADRLFKIRHCLNIEGVFRQLALFEPPIDPALLVRARAVGVDLRDVLAGEAHLCPYRFQTLLQLAKEFCGDVRALGAALLSAIERKDAEALALLRSQQEIQLLDAVQEIREKQVEEATENQSALEQSLDIVGHRRDHYEQLSLHLMNDAEGAQTSHLHTSHAFEVVAQSSSLAASISYMVPDFDLGASGWAGSPVVKAIFGGGALGNAMRAVGELNRMFASQYAFEAQMSGIMAGYQRRNEEWIFQAELARRELVQIDKQKAAADLRIEIAKKERDNHKNQRDNARAVDAFMREKFSNQELFAWMERETAASYFQSYQLALDLARRAERALRFECGLDGDRPPLVRMGQWDSLRRGLLAGERLQLDLRRLETAWLDQNRRELEITKNISLAQLNPLALIAIRSTGECDFSVPEVLFDLDFPGHYFRRIKSVSLTMPSIVGPFTGVHASLTLDSSEWRKNTGLKEDGRYRKTLATDGGDADVDDRFVSATIPVQGIATSGANNDSGVFELNFRDERYLPFEGAGAISRWRLRLPPVEFQPFDYRTISDVVLHVRYTARDGGDAFRSNVKEELASGINEVILNGNGSGFFRLFDLRSDFPNQWHGFLTSTDHQQSFEITQDRFPYLFQGKTLAVQEGLIAYGVPKDRTSELPDVRTWFGPMRALGPLQLATPVGEAETIAGLETIIVVLRYQISTAS